MKRTKRSKRVKRSIFDIKSYILVFFGVFAGCTLCSMLVLRGLYPDLSPIGIGKLEILGDILAISLGYTLIVLIYRGITIENPTRRILSATEKIGKGDFTVKIKPVNKGRRTNEYDVIIEDLNKMVTELSAIETLRSDFVATVSHELKTPLAVVQNYCMLLQNPDITETERTQYVQSITSATKRLTELINNILKLNKLENQRIFPEFSTVNLTESLCESILLFEKDWDEKNIDLQTDIPDGLFIRADGELLSLVWSNLLSNALKFTPDGGTISVRAVDYKKSTIVTVADNGCGIPEEALPHIFEKFYQGDKSRSSQGNGLGLALVKRIADIHGGTVRVSSVCEKDKPDGGADKPEKLNISVPATPTHGTTFTVILPKN